MSEIANLASGLSELATQVRSVTLRQLEASDGPMLTWTPHGTSNHILWHAGHALWVADILTIEPITGRGELPSGWAESFGEVSNPAATKRWPGAAEVCELLATQLDRILDLFRQDAQSIIARASEVMPQNGWPLLSGIVHGWHDEARHQGEMHLLAKLYRNQRL
jgi:hypothetical protein